MEHGEGKIKLYDNFVLKRIIFFIFFFKLFIISIRPKRFELLTNPL